MLSAASARRPSALERRASQAFCVWALTSAACLAAVSSAAYLVVNTLTDVRHVPPLSLRVDEGQMFFRIEPKDEPLCRDLLAGLKLHLTALEEQYPGCLKVGYLEV